MKLKALSLNFRDLLCGIPALFVSSVQEWIFRHCPMLSNVMHYPMLHTSAHTSAHGNEQTPAPCITAYLLTLYWI